MADDPAIQITDDLYWIGVRNPELKVFDIVMRTDEGTTYNSYLLRGKQNVVFETVKEGFWDEYIARIESVIGSEGTVDYIVLNHTEPDHSGCLYRLVERYPRALVLATPPAIEFLGHISNRPLNTKETENNMEMTIERRDSSEEKPLFYILRFIIAPFLHWPDSQFTYIGELDALITCDFFGAHYSDKNKRLFNDEVKGNFLYAYKYYFDCIFGPYKKYVRAGLEKISALPREVKFICCSHGPVLRDNLKYYFDLYAKWATEVPPEDKVVIVYVSAYGYTQDIARSIAAGLSEKGVAAKFFDLVTDSQEEAANELASAKGVLFGTPTIISDALEPIYEMVLRLNPVIHTDMVAGSFGSYGWVGEGAFNIDQMLEMKRLKVPLDPLRIRFKPDTKQLESAVEFGRKFGLAVTGTTVNERTFHWAKQMKGAFEDVEEEGRKGADDDVVRKWKCIVCGEVFYGPRPPLFCPACGALEDQIIEIAMDEEDLNPVKGEPFAGALVIVGGGCAAHNAAKAARQASAKAKITVLSKEAYRPYYRPMISDVVGMAETEGHADVIEPTKMEGFYVVPEEWYAEKEVDLRLETEVVDVHHVHEGAEKKEGDESYVVLANGDHVMYDRLVIATGASPFNPCRDKGLVNLENVFTIRGPTDAIALRRYARDNQEKVKSLVLVGGGLLALEACSELIDLGIFEKIHIVEVADRILPFQLDQDGADIMVQLMEKKGVTLHLSSTVLGVEPCEDGKRCAALPITGDRKLKADIVIFSCGVISDTDLARKLGCEVLRGIKVDEHMQTTVPNVYACGDCAQFGARPFPIWPVAAAQGETAGSNACGKKRKFHTEKFPYLLDAFDLRMFSVGDIVTDCKTLRAVSTPGTEGDDGRVYTKLFFQNGHLKGGILMGNVGKSVSLVQKVNADASFKSSLSILS